MDWGFKDYQIGSLAHELQEKIDGRLYLQMQEQSDRVEELTKRIHQLNRMITEFDYQRRGNNGEIDLSELESLVDEFRSIWQEFQEEFPLLSKDECPFPPDIDLTKVDQNMLDRVFGHIESMKMRYQNKIPVIMEKLNTASALYRVLSEICPEMAKTAREEKNNSIRRQIQG